MKDHEVALLINELVGIAQEHGQPQHLRARITESVKRALSSAGVPVGRDEEERRLFAVHMEAQGFAPDAVAPPKPPMTHYRSSHVETCWEAWAGCLKAHGLNREYEHVKPQDDEDSSSAAELFDTDAAFQEAVELYDELLPEGYGWRRPRAREDRTDFFGVQIGRGEGYFSYPQPRHHNAMVELSRQSMARVLYLMFVVNPGLKALAMKIKEKKAQELSSRLDVDEAKP